MFVLFPGLALSDPAPVPSTGNKPADFAPKGWFILKEAQGDLNKDGLKDTALILAPDGEKSEDLSAATGERTLALLLANPDGSLSLSASKGGFILGKWDGGMMGDPLQDFLIDRGAVVIGIYGGSRDRWGMTYRFRWQNNDWHLIGYTTLAADNLELTSTTIDANWNTGDVEITSMKEGNVTSKRRVSKKFPPLTLREFTPKKAEDALEK